MGEVGGPVVVAGAPVVVAGAPVVVAGGNVSPVPVVRYIVVGLMIGEEPIAALHKRYI